MLGALSNWILDALLHSGAFSFLPFVLHPGPFPFFDRLLLVLLFFGVCSLRAFLAALMLFLYCMLAGNGAGATNTGAAELGGAGAGMSVEGNATG
jgi:hypothetical protein